MRRALIALTAVVFAMPRASGSQEPNVPTCFDCGADHPRVLLIGAHPDDEDTNLIAWLQRGGRASTAYLSLTRGDGGQNLIGNELGEELGIIRTEELLAARRVDGAAQFFTRAYDFGFSKSAAETYAHWPKDSLLDDVVAVVRAWRPDLIIMMFSGTPRDGHGHHQVSALLAKEAYAVSADTIRFPVNKFGSAWTVSKLYQTSRFQPDSATLRFNVGEYNEKLSRSYAEIAGESRSLHKSQGFGALQRKGVVWNYVQRLESRVNAATPAKAEKSILDGVVPRWRDGTDYGADELVPRHSALEAIADRQYLAIGDSARIMVTYYNRNRRPVTVFAGLGGERTVEPDSSTSWVTYMKGREITQPWWLVTPRNGDLFSAAIPRAVPGVGGRPPSEDVRQQNDWITAGAMFGGVHLAEERVPAVYRTVDPIRGDVQRPLVVVPAISITLDRAVELARADVPFERFVNVTLRSALTKPAAIRVLLSLPPGLAADSASRSIAIDSAGTRRITFRVRGKLTAGDHLISASAIADGRTYNSGYIPIDYDHITPQRLYRPAATRVRAVDLRYAATVNVGYIQGVGDKVAPALQQLGIPVTLIAPGEVPSIDLSKFSAVVVGPRAYDAHRELIDNNTYLLDYARNGGTLVVQYGQYEMMRAGVMPYAITISRPHDRVTEEVAPVTILDAASPALTAPNRITAADFEGWVQERGLYMPRTFDERFRPVVEVNDPGAPPNRGGIIVAPYGKGLYVYTTLAFFRQLPAGVSGAAKLFVNLISSEARGFAPTQTKAGSQ